MKDKKIILLGGYGQSTSIVFNALNEKFNVVTAIIEDKEPLKIFLKRRIKRLGFTTVFGQICFQLIIPKTLHFLSKNRNEEILKSNNLITDEIPSHKIKKTTSINSKSSIELIKSLNPDLIIVNGTRIISKKVLQSVNCKFINTHAGITPMYRGVHGTYWALVNNDVDNSGVTVHFVDEGIDTGNIIAQKQIVPNSHDNFSTYPMLQLSIGVKLLVEAVDNYFNERIVISKEKGKSKLYYHPTIWGYMYHRISRGIK
ncbi:formyl transferase [Chryseobacterium turcicum]|uniref:phosphoribosylglycinamide formyltransferase 1 n=1 Tax=Chryseobacterium turcicum TaxID=2898076 RepID=A0A9Q3V3B5_9FLAO|nr:formyl transferase [Chryseobacterium turcicum]MCD1116963.1 formyl transferase [Chryseobacterium turcicum]